jgi:hypothetical protein
MKLRIGIAVLMLATAITAHGQATPACGPPVLTSNFTAKTTFIAHGTLQPTVTAFDTERREPFVGGVSTTIPPNPSLLPFVPGLINGTLEIRERLIYDPPKKAIALTTFIIATATPFPTSDSDLAALGTVVERATLGVEAAFFSCSPLPSVTFAGTVTEQSFPQPGDAVYPGGWGVDIQGATFALSFGYTTDSNPTPPVSSYWASYCTGLHLFNVTESVPGVGVAWAPCAAGTFTISIPPGS